MNRTTISLSDPRMNEAQKTGLFGFCRFITQAKDMLKRKGINASFNEISAVLEYECSTEKMLDAIISMQFRLTDGMIDLLSCKDSLPTEEQISIWQDIMLETLLGHHAQHVKIKERKKETVGVPDDATKIVSFDKTTITQYIHMKSTRKPSRRDLYKIGRYMVPCYENVNGSGEADGDIFEPLELYICDLFFISGCVAYRSKLLFSEQGKCLGHKYFLLSFTPKNLIALCQEFDGRFFENSGLNLAGDQPEEAVLRFYLSFRINENFDRDISSLTVYEFSKIKWNKHFKIVTRILPCYERVSKKDLELFVRALTCFRTRIMEHKVEEGKPKTYFRSPPPELGLIADNIVSRKPWYSGCTDACKYPSKGWRVMVEQSKGSDLEEREANVVKIVHKAWRIKIAKIYGKMPRPLAQAKISKTRDNIRLTMRGCKSPSKIYHYFIYEFGLSCRNFDDGSSVSEAWSKFLSSFNPDDRKDMRRLGDLVWLGIMSYKPSEKEADDTVVDNKVTPEEEENKGESNG